MIRSLTLIFHFQLSTENIYIYYFLYIVDYTNQINLLKYYNSIAINIKNNFAKYPGIDFYEGYYFIFDLQVVPLCIHIPGKISILLT